MAFRSIPLFLLLLGLAAPTVAQDSTTATLSVPSEMALRIDTLQRTVNDIRDSQDQFVALVGRLERRLATAQQNGASLETTVDSLANAQVESQDDFAAAQVRLQARIDSIRKVTSSQVSEVTLSIDRLGIKSLWLAIVLLLIVGVVTWVFHRRTNAVDASIVDRLSESRKELEHEMLSVDEKLSELLTSKLATVASAPGGEVDHEFPLRVANEMTRMQNNLQAMGEDVRGVRQLLAAVRRMGETLEHSGYAVAALAGKPYHEGMNVVAHFKHDDSLPADTSIITRVVKPQVTFKNEIVQLAEVDVSQNLL